jgi:predicted ester cyclase
MASDDDLTASALLRRYLEAGDAQDYPTFERVLAPAVRTHSPGGVETVGTDAQVAAWMAAHEGLDGLRHDVRDVVGEGEVAAARVRVSGVHNGPFLGVAPTGARVDVDQALFVRVESDRIAEIWEVVDTGAGLRQIGVLGDQVLSPGAGPAAP